jgi:7-carboxy-7-deazaguanine synthase
MTYTVHELFYTLQGEGANAGCPAVFCRFAGCNLWTGREEDRARAVCRFCDTQFRGGQKFKTAGALATAIRDLWPGGRPGFARR